LLGGFAGIEGNSIFSNTSDGSILHRGLGIDLSGDGPTPNDDCDADGGPNDLQNFPVLTSAVATASSIEIQGTLNSAASTSFRIEFFCSDACDPSGYGQGKTFLGFANVMTDASCNATFDVTLPVVVPAGQVATATATGPAPGFPALPGFTSEF